MKEYNHSEIEQKWQKEWIDKKIFEAKDDTKLEKFYSLIEFPYPSGDGLHVGHPRPYIGMDVISRKRRAEGYNVLYPIGWDAFGLPTENYAIKTGKRPQQVTKENSDNFRRQIQLLGISFDWSREINTTDPKYYKWTQWLFLQFLKHDLAYKAKMAINWCPKDKIGLANEEVVNGCCERCGTPVEKREKEQWMLAITKYAERLDKDLDTVDYLPQIKLQQKNWIGKSEGMLFTAPIKDTDMKIETFSAHFEAFCADTFVVIAPDHPLLPKLIEGVANKNEIIDFCKKIISTRLQNKEEKEPEGIFIGRYIIDPVGNGDLPIWVASYALADYGTGIVKCSAHDERDYQFAKKYNIPLKEVLIPKVVDTRDPPKEGVKTVERTSIQAIIINPKDNKVLTLKWKKFPWTTFVTGGVEGNEDMVEAAKREILEETGYQNTKFIRQLGGPVESHFFANHKNENRKALFYALVFELQNEEKKEVSEEEKQIHEPEWMSWEELEKDTNMKCAEYDIWMDRFFNPPHAWIDMKSAVLTEPKEFAGKVARDVRNEIVEYLEAKGLAKRKTTFKLRDWVFSRQRYWGEPIPVVHCEKDGIIPLPESELPLVLPEVEKYQPTDTGESPLATISEWVNTTCPKCGGAAQRETDTMPNWAGSSWYFLRYIDPHNDKEFAGKEKLKYWMPIDWYNGGMEHTTLHLLYSRFWNKFLFDIGLVPTSEPYKKRTSHGLILAKGGEKMSKSKGNVVNPDEIVKTYGADTLRMYEMFMGPFDQAIAWGEENIIGVRRFLERVWRLGLKIEVRSRNYEEKKAKNSKFEILNSKFDSLLHKTIKKVSGDIEEMSFNTAVSAMMIIVNEMEKLEKINQTDFEIFLKILSPFAPHIAEELWHSLGHKTLIVLEKWPEVNQSKMKETETTIAVQVNSKVRAECTVTIDSTKEEVIVQAKNLPVVEKWLSGKEVKKVIYVPNKLINFVL